MKWGITKDLRVIGAEEAAKIWGGKIWYQDIIICMEKNYNPME